MVPIPICPVLTSKNDTVVPIPMVISSWNMEVWNVETPETFTLSSSVCPSTSKPTPIVSVDPSKVRLASSSNSPPVPTITTLLSVRSSTLNEFACPPALISIRPSNVDNPTTLKFVEVASV